MCLKGVMGARDKQRELEIAHILPAWLCHHGYHLKLGAVPLYVRQGAELRKVFRVKRGASESIVQVVKGQIRGPDTSLSAAA